jgi:hypothetical protein
MAHHGYHQNHIRNQFASKISLFLPTVKKHMVPELAFLNTMIKKVFEKEFNINTSKHCTVSKWLVLQIVGIVIILVSYRTFLFFSRFLSKIEQVSHIPNICIYWEFNLSHPAHSQLFKLTLYCFNQDLGQWIVEYYMEGSCIEFIYN